ncbi:hypothetical protein V6N13_009807 [Hibiscus sabdariffa]
MFAALCKPRNFISRLSSYGSGSLRSSSPNKLVRRGETCCVTSYILLASKELLFVVFFSFGDSLLSSYPNKKLVRRAMDFALKKIDKYVDNHTSLDQRMKDLKRKLEQLNGLKEDAESIMTTELQPRKKPKAEVQIWFKNVERIKGEVQDLDGRIGESNVLTRGFHAEDASRKIKEVEELINQRRQFHGGLVVDNPQWIGQVLSTTSLSGEAVKACVEEIWQCLMDDEVGKIGVWGMGGVGKTSLMKLINNQLLKETEKFDIVIWVTVSKEMSIAKLQRDIASKIEVVFSDDEDETTRAGKLFETLSQKSRFVMILDDLWEKISLETMGIPEPSVGSKLMLTTRSYDVCRQMCCRVIRVKPLTKEEAWKLFLEKVGRDILNIPGVEPIARSIAKRCAENVPSLSNLRVLKLDLGGTHIKKIPQGMENLLRVGETLISGKEVGGLKKLEVLEGRFEDWDNLNMYLQGFHGREEPPQYRISVGDVEWDVRSWNKEGKVIGVRGCEIHTYQMMLPPDIEELEIHNCDLDCSEEYPLFSRSILSSLSSFSSLKSFSIYGCRNMKKLFSPNCVPLNLEELSVSNCEQLEEIITSEVEQEGRGGMEFRLPQLRRLQLFGLPELKRIHALLVCDSLVQISIVNCVKLERIGLNLPPPAPDSVSIRIWPREWWESVEWDAKPLLKPIFFEVHYSSIVRFGLRTTKFLNSQPHH